MQTDPTLHEELAAYFGGTCEGTMGLGSWLGRWADFGPVRGGQTTAASAPEPGGDALAAARTMNRVEQTLAMLDREHALVLEGFYTPRPPCARGASRLGAIAGVVGTLPRAVLAVLESERARRYARVEERRAQSLARVRMELQVGTAEGARMELELMPLVVAELSDPTLEIQVLLMMPGRESRRILQKIETAANTTLRAAMVAYGDAADTHRANARADRRQRFARAAVGA